MNASSHPSSADDDAIESAAAEWLIRREEGLTAAEAAAFAAWRAADPAHEAAVLRTERALALIAELPAVRAPLQASLDPELTITRTPVLRWPLWLGGLAAALAVVVGVWSLLPAGAAPAQHYATAALRQQQVALGDGSVLNLNVSTQVQVALTPEARRITLTAGEAHFAVAHDTARPFIVTAGDVAVRAVGTAFSVRLGDQGVEVLVTDGKVEITRGADSATNALPAEHPFLVAGELTYIASDELAGVARIERIPADALQAAVRWHSQVMTFTDLPLRDAVTLFNRRNAQQLVLGDAALGERRIGGTFAADQVEAFVRLLVEDGDIAVERRSVDEIVLRRAP